MFKAKQLVVKVGFVATSFCAANAMAGAVAGGASEWTQIANNFQLIQVAMDSAASASAEASQYALQIQQFRTQINNLEKLGQLPSNIVANQSALEGLRAYTSALGQLQGSLGSPERAGTSTWPRCEKMRATRTSGRSTDLNMRPQSWTKFRRITQRFGNTSLL